MLGAKLLPHQQAGLEIGDEIRSVNGLDFHHARDSYDAVNMLSRFVSSTPVSGGPAPAVTTTARTYVAPGYPSIANMIVRNARSGQDVSVAARPHRHSVVALAAAATIAQ